MARSIWKYGIAVKDEPTTYAIPSNDVIVHVADQGGVPTIWAIVDPENDTELRSFIVTGTGHPAPDAKYIGTAVGSIFVWHVWEIDPDQFDGSSEGADHG